MLTRDGIGLLDPIQYSTALAERQAKESQPSLFGRGAGRSELFIHWPMDTVLARRWPLCVPSRLPAHHVVIWTSLQPLANVSLNAPH